MALESLLETWVSTREMHRNKVARFTFSAGKNSQITVSVSLLLSPVSANARLQSPLFERLDLLVSPLRHNIVYRFACRKVLRSKVRAVEVPRYYN